MMDDTSSVTKTSTYIEPEVWQSLSTDQRQAIIQAQEMKPPEQDRSKKGPNGTSKNNRACRAKAARPEKPRNSRNLLPMRGNDRWGHLNGLG